MPDAKEVDRRPAVAIAQRDASIASNATSSGRRMTRPVAPERIDAQRRVDLGRDLDLPADRGVAVGLQHRGGLDRIALEPRARGARAAAPAS